MQDDITTLFSQALDGMAQRARAVPTPGVAVVGYLPASEALHWRIAHQTVERMTRAPGPKGPANFFAVAFSKAGEMMDTFKDSGSGVRPPILGETGFRGGAVERLPGGGCVLAAFSGGTSDEDYEISRWAVRFLAQAL